MWFGPIYRRAAPDDEDPDSGADPDYMNAACLAFFHALPPMERVMYTVDAYPNGVARTEDHVDRMARHFIAREVAYKRLTT